MLLRVLVVEQRSNVEHSDEGVSLNAECIEHAIYHLSQAQVCLSSIICLCRSITAILAILT